MRVADAAYQVLNKEAGKPLHCRELAKRMVASGLWRTVGKTPWETVRARIGEEIKQYGDKSRFIKTGPGQFAARGPSDLFGGLSASVQKKPVPPPRKRTINKMSFLDAAEQVLRRLPSGQRMHYKEITRRALDAGLIRTKGKTPDATMAAQIGTDIRRREERGELQRFVRDKRGMVGLAGDQMPRAMTDLIHEHNEKARRELLNRARKGSSAEFEELIERLLVEMGFEDVEKTPMGRDGGIDVRGTLVVGDVVRIRMAVQAKRWKGNVQKPIVQQVRGALGANEQGLIITTGGFSKGAQEEAGRTGVSPVALMDGEQLAVLLARYQVGAERHRHVLITLDPLD